MPLNPIRELIFGGELDESSIDEAESTRETDPSSTDQSKVWTRESLYVQVIERAINHIAQTESERNLFTQEEWDYLYALSLLEYHVRFILIRLTLRSLRWLRINNLRKYVGEVGEDGLRDALEKLCKLLTPEIIDLTMDSDDEESPSSSNKTPEVSLSYFCQGQDDLKTPEGLQLLLVDELKGLCKNFGIQHAKLTKDAMITALIENAEKQTTLPYDTKPKGKAKGKAQHSGLRQTTLSFAPPKKTHNQTELLRRSMLKLVDLPIRVNPHLCTLIRRLDIIWFRQTQFPESLFTTALLTGFNKRTYASYDHVRDPDIWRTRERYLQYEAGIQVEAAVDDLLKPESSKGKTETASPVKKWMDLIQRITSGAEADEYDDEEAPPRRQARIIKKILEEHALPVWEKLVLAESSRTTFRKNGLERFEPGYVYARILRKCGEALATLKEFESEKALLDKLLDQRHWRRASRARWYERRALVMMKYLHKNSDGTDNMDVLQEVRQGLIDALADEDTATVLRPALIRRLGRVERALRLSDAQKTKYDIVLKKPEVVSFEAVRVYDAPDTIKLDSRGKVKGKENQTVDIQRFLQVPSHEEPEAKKSAPAWRWKGKSLWQGKDGTCNVETRAIQYYEERGFKGIHSETQILTTLFGLLFWDIIFAPIPGAFETPWQLGPLDIGEDSFYHARRDLIEKRLVEIRDGGARAILEARDDRCREAKTCCIGVNWQMCGRDELVEITECLGGERLSTICRLFCEDYDGRRSGVPDLIVWNPETKECKFVEVKGPGDSAQENQKLWFDALLTARCSVELCKVVDKNGKKKAPAKKKTPKPRRQSRANSSRTPTAAVRTPSVEPELEEEEQEEEQDMVVDDVANSDESWEPSTAVRRPPSTKLRRRRLEVEDDDELPVFAPSEPGGSSHHPVCKRQAGNFSTPPPKKFRSF